MNGSSCDILIVGGGVIGCAVAFFLSERDEGRRLVVRVAEPDPTYSRSSTALSVGGVRQQFSTPENVRMSLFSAQFFRDASRRLAVEGAVPDLGFREAGYLFLATAPGLSVLRENHALQMNLGAQVALLTPADLAERFPWMNTDDLAGGSLGLRGEGWLDPFSLLQAFRAKARAQGVDFIQDEVTAMEVGRTGVAKARLKEAGWMDVGVVVNAAGPRASEVAAMAGLSHYPVRPRKRFVFRFHCREKVAGVPLTIDPCGVYFRPEGPDFLCGVSPAPENDPDTLDLTVNHDLFQEVLWPALAHRVPAFQAIRPRDAWAGHYAVNTIDRNAILGPHPQVPNFFLANGFSGHGLQQSPAVGLALSELILDGRYRTMDLTRFGYQRFETGELCHERNVV